MQDDAAKAVVNFRRERLEEPAELYLEHFETIAPVFEQLIKQLSNLKAENLEFGDFVELISNPEKRRALLYITAPPISDDNLKTLSEISSFSSKSMTDERAQRLRDLLFRILDPKRFPWIAENRQPTVSERKAAVIASSALIAARKVETFRRNDAKEQQEASVKDMLRKLGFTEIDRRPIPHAAATPKPGEFMGETKVAGARADVVAGLPDGRTLITECKVSNSKVNSYKRIVHDTGGKSTIWYDQFGRANIVVTAVLSGVFSPPNLEHVQNDKDVFLFWAHRLGDLKSFINSVK